MTVWQIGILCALVATICSMVLVIAAHSTRDWLLKAACFAEIVAVACAVVVFGVLAAVAILPQAANW